MTEEQVMDFEVPDGTATKTVYVVNYDEDLWYQLPQETRDFCYHTWVKIAKPLGVEEVVLILIPDAIFPSHGKERPHVAWRHKFSKVASGEWVEKVTVVVTMDTDPIVLNAWDIERFKGIWAKYPKNTRFCLNSLQGKPMMEHTT